ncbi:MAG: class III signal peptide-containing protein [Candidatus Micrarchaeia archaeon]
MDGFPNMKRGQTTIEFLLLLSVVILLVLAAITTVSDVTKVQQNATQAVRTGVENASLALLQQFAEQRVGLQLTNVSQVSADLARLEVVKNDPYFSNQPAILQVVAWNDYSGVMYVPELRMEITGPGNADVLASPSSEFNVTVTLARTITVSFVPTAIGNYNITVMAYGEDGSLLKQKKVPFTVIGGGVGGAEFSVEKKIVVNRTTPGKPSHYLEVLQLPNATVRSASLEFLDMHRYADRNISFHIYDRVFKWSETLQSASGNPAVSVTSYRMTNSPYQAVIPEDAIIKHATLVIENSNVWVGWPDQGSPLTASPGESATMQLIHSGPNMITVEAAGADGYGRHEVNGAARPFVEYDGPEERQARADEMFYGIKVNGQDAPLGTFMDLAPYLHAGYNQINFTYINGTFTYRLHITTG